LHEGDLYLLNGNTPVNVLPTLLSKLTAGIAISTGDNLDDYTDNVRAYCNANATAATVANIPVAAAGFLDVQTTGATVFQTYQTYNNAGSYTRYRYGGTWSTWKLCYMDDVIHKLNKTVTGTTSSSNSYISLGLNADYGVLAVRDTASTHICIPYWSTASNGWYARVLTTAMGNANNATVTLDVDYYLK